MGTIKLLYERGFLTETLGELFLCSPNGLHSNTDNPTETIMRYKNVRHLPSNRPLVSVHIKEQPFRASSSFISVCALEKSCGIM